MQGLVEGGGYRPVLTHPKLKLFFAKSLIWSYCVFNVVLVLSVQQRTGITSVFHYNQTSLCFSVCCMELSYCILNYVNLSFFNLKSFLSFSFANLGRNLLR